MNDEPATFDYVMHVEPLAVEPPPIDIVLHCPRCKRQHIDALEVDNELKAYTSPSTPWTNPPHRSHFCRACGCIWRPADVPTNGVASVKTRGKDDTWPQQVK